MRGAAAVAGPVAERGPVRFTIEPDSAALRFGAPAVSPDGRTVVYAVTERDDARLYARQLEDVAARPLAGTEDGDLPFFSPDGRWVGFYSNGALRKVRLAGGPAEVVARMPPPAAFGGASWGEDDVIVYSGRSRTLYRVPAAGGSASRVAAGDGAPYLLQPHLLPGGRAALVTTTPDFTAGRVAVLDLASGQLRQFGPGSAPRYVAGDIVYVGVGGELLRQPFDLERLEPTGTAEQVGSGLDAFTVTHSVGVTPFDASPAGVLVYRVAPSPSPEGNLRLVLVDRTGRQLRAIPARVPWAPRFSPDGARVAYGAFGPGRDSSDVWITDVRTGATMRLTNDARDNNDPHWSPDGTAVAYSADTAGGKDIVAQRLDGGPARRFPRSGVQWPSDWAGDGSALLFTDGVPGGGQDIWAQPTAGGPARPYVATPAVEMGARLSPDGRWVAYTSDETGRTEVYVNSYPTPGRRTLVSVGGGTNPVWAPDGGELYYWRFDQLVAARVAAPRDAPIAVRSRTPLFRAPYFENVHPMYDVGRDGTRFLLVTGGARAGRLVVALDVLRGERRRTPAGH